ncbi:MAG: glycosyltransferase family 2 protein [Chloroflexi bacterium]|nr:glycosyltransferase family 2 protein [Chloroflexota bacterium]
MTTKPVVSIIAPVYNEEPIIDELYRRLVAVLDTIGEPWELVMVNDGSTDRSVELMVALHARDPRVRVINFARNFGHQNAVTAGMDYARGDTVVIIDADLQDPPEVILQLLDKWREGYHVVYAVRSERKGETWFKKFTAKLFYRVIYRITDVNIPLDTGDFRLMDRQVVDAVKQMREHNRFIRGMTSWVGFRQTGVDYVRQERFAGETKYPLRKMMRFALDAITGFSYFPLQVMIYASLVLALIAVLAVPIVAFLRLAGASVFEGQATTLVVLLLLSSFQLFFFFIMGQYVARIYDETRQRPLYIVSKVWERPDALHAGGEAAAAPAANHAGGVTSPGQTAG